MTRRKAYTFILLFNCYLTSPTQILCNIIITCMCTFGIDEQTQKKEREQASKARKRNQAKIVKAFKIIQQNQCVQCNGTAFCYTTVFSRHVDDGGEKAADIVKFQSTRYNMQMHSVCLLACCRFFSTSHHYTILSAI